MGATKIEWADIPGFPGYSVNAAGAIYGRAGKILRPMESSSGHLYIIPRVNNIGVKLFVHRAVLLAFVGLPPPGEEARHLDGNPRNNHISNLAWGTRSEQHEDDRRNGVCRTARLRRLSAEQVERIRATAGTISLRTLAKEYGISHTSVLKARKGTTYVR